MDVVRERTAADAPGEPPGGGSSTPSRQPEPGSARAGRVAAGLLAVALLTGCGGEQGASAPAASPPAAAPTAVPTAAAPEPTAAAPEPTAAEVATCPDDPVEAGVCRLVSAVQARDLSGLSPGEQVVAAAAQDDLPTGEWTSSCELVGDVTVLCEVTVAGAAEVVGLHVAPVNAEYDDGAVTVPEGEQIRYEVVEHLGTGEAGSFG